MLQSAEDLATELGRDRLRAFSPTEMGPGWVEIRLRFGSVTLAFPELWKSAGKDTRSNETAIASHLRRSRSGYCPLVLLGSDDLFADPRAERLCELGEVALEVLPLALPRLTALLERHDDLLRLRRYAAESEIAADRYQEEIDSLTAIGRALSSERNLDRLLGLVLQKSRLMTDADAGSIYVVEGKGEPGSERMLRFKVSQNDSLRADFAEFTLPVSPESIVGRCVLERSVINIPDLYGLDANNRWGFKHNRAFDERSGYETHSMLTVPMIDPGDQVIGVIQLINRKRRPEAVLREPADFVRWVVPFGARAQGLAATLASQAGIALENAMLYTDIRNLFEGFVTASVTAIEQRDPTTSGHSQRVADLTVGLAKTTERVARGSYGDYRTTSDELKQIEYAALLHDFGKVGVRENVLVKAKKLYEHERELLLARFDFIRRDVEAEIGRKKIEALVAGRGSDALGLLDIELAARLAEIDEFTKLVLSANEPTILEKGGFERLADLGERSFTDVRGASRPYLTPREIEALQVMRGSLTNGERVEIESHVSHTYNFLRRIPWGRVFKDVPEYAGSHHEKLDGTGYPRRLAGASIPIPARMMTIADIYDALTASDRPYKRAVPVDKALDIISSEVKAGKCDAELFQIFVEAEVYKIAHDKRRSG